MPHPSPTPDGARYIGLEQLAEEAADAAMSLSAEGDRAIADVYLKVISKAITKGVDYFQNESNRAKGMLRDGKMKKEKKDLFDRSLRFINCWEWVQLFSLTNFV